ncbi:hypothetical protein WPS_28050 [Vulcanimicrobium alpinum]|uniref:ERCC4 domain-containing protein n=1 Tax=Vulcanimicrobium alpinum TaxID=3016050 RepID=A0AAN2CAM8_UNVUL|nr:hypothetical protein WPS_28050 [Vulcanimicrobium alpinum]
MRLQAMLSPNASHGCGTQCPFVLGCGKPYFARARAPLRHVGTNAVGEDAIKLTFARPSPRPGTHGGTRIEVGAAVRRVGGGFDGQEARGVEEFIVARNPDKTSSLPFLVHLPIDGGLWLKARDSWPRTARVYCHPADDVDIDRLEIVERVGVLACVRRGVAIDLVLERGVNRRSQFVTTTARGRRMVLWQTQKVATSARPGVRIPSAAPSPLAVIFIDTRERYGYTFAGHAVRVERRALSAGDYAVAMGDSYAVIERKRLDDFASSLSNAQLGYTMAELALLPAAAVVVEGTYSKLLRLPHAPTGYLADLAARLQVRYPTVPIVYVESRKLGQEWSYRFFKAALAREESPELELRPEPRSTEPPKPRRRRTPKRGTATDATPSG